MPAAPPRAGGCRRRPGRAADSGQRGLFFRIGRFPLALSTARFLIFQGFLEAFKLIDKVMNTKSIVLDMIGFMSNVCCS